MEEVKEYVKYCNLKHCVCCVCLYTKAPCSSTLICERSYFHIMGHSIVKMMA